MRKYYLGVLLALTAAFAWSFNGILAKQVDLSGITIAMGRDLVCFILFFSITKIRNKTNELKELLNNFKVIIFLSLFFALNGILSFESYKLTFIANTSTLSFMFPIFIAVLSPIFLKTKLKFDEVIGIVLSVIGVLLIFHSTFTNLLGNTIALISALSFAIYTIILKKKDFKVSTESLMTLIFGFSLVWIVLVSAIVGNPIFGSFNSNNLLYVFLIGVIGGFIGHEEYTKSIHLIKAHLASTIVLFSPIFATILAWILVKETLPGFGLIGIFLTTFGVFFTIKSKN